MTPANPATADDNAVTAWFGAGFERLHPLLQALHRDGGVLEGAVTLRFGAGLAGVLGRRLARRMGLPTRAGTHALQVDIGHDAHALHWQRCFNGQQRVISHFQPYGAWPDGCWIERTGPLQLQLAVDTRDGGWHWRVLGLRLGGLRMPRWLLPRSRAYKCVEAGRYRFFVGFALPLLGEVVAYSGLLEARAR